MDDDKAFLFKILLIGDCNVGKSSLMRRYVDNQYSEGYIATIGVDFKIKTLMVGDIMVKLQLWDTAGQERFQSITQTYYRGCDGVFLVVDMTNVQTLRELPRKWMSEVTRYCGIKDKDDPHAPVMIVLANKCDKTKELQIKDAHLKGLLVSHFKTSAKEGINVQKAFEEMATQILDKRTQHHLSMMKAEERERSSRYQSFSSLYRQNGNKVITLEGDDEQDEKSKRRGCLC